MEMEATLPAETPAAADAGEIAEGLDGLSSAVATAEGVRPAAPSGDPGLGTRKRGRPPIHGLYSKAAGSDGKNPAPHRVAVEFPAADGEPPQPAPPENRVSLPPDLVAKVVQEGLNFAESFAANKIQGAALAAGLTPADIGPQLAQTRLGDRRKALIAELTPLALQEWGVDPKLSPSLALALLLAPWAFGAFSAYSELAKLAVEKAKRDKATAPAKEEKP
jgi:hypothetical protein